MIVKNNALIFAVLVSILWGLVACQPTAQSTTTTLPTQPTRDRLAAVGSVTPIPTVAIVATETPTTAPTQPPTHTPVPIDTLVPTETPTVTLTYTPTLTPSATLTEIPSITPTLERADHYRLRRPINRITDEVDYVDRTYPYGGTQSGQRGVHLGSDFFNSRHTAVVAAAGGTVLYAGRDDSQAYGPSTDYYGNLIIIEHEITSPTGLSVSTLYGHLQEVLVETGQRVESGVRIGTVGDEGIAIGPHLHFEVRLGDPTDYHNTTNPELWLIPYQGYGTLAGRIVNRDGVLVYGTTIVVSNASIQRETYTYGGDRVNADPVWGENFVLGDLPQGDYSVAVMGGAGQVRYRGDVTIEIGKTSWLDIQLER